MSSRSTVAALRLSSALYQTRQLHCRYLFHGSRCILWHQPVEGPRLRGQLQARVGHSLQEGGLPGRQESRRFVFHNTRHTALTNLVNADVPAHEAMPVSGHHTRSVFDRYSLSLKQQTKAALRRVTEYTQQQDTTATVIPVQRPVQRAASATGPTT